MDPDACLNIIIESIKDGDRDQTMSSLEDLYHWLRGGGCMPASDILLLGQVSRCPECDEPLPQHGKTCRPDCV
jgi:hypothetical protein